MIEHIKGVDLLYWNPQRRRASGRLGEALPRRRERETNFGDMLSPIIVNRLTAELEPRRSPTAAALVAVGSIVHMAPVRSTVWGSGINGKEPVSSLKPNQLDVRAVRGPRTRDLLRSVGVRAPEVFGDPGLLVPRLLPEWIEPESSRRGVLVVPNLHDLKRLGSTYPVLNPRSSVEECVRTISSSEFVVASSLHGLVIADALQIPSALLAPRTEPPFKYEDYYAGTGRTLPSPAATVQEAVKSPAPPIRDWDGERLLDAFPRDLWS